MMARGARMCVDALIDSGLTVERATATPGASINLLVGEVETPSPVDPLALRRAEEQTTANDQMPRWQWVAKLLSDQHYFAESGAIAKLAQTAEAERARANAELESRKKYQARCLELLKRAKLAESQVSDLAKRLMP